MFNTNHMGQTEPDNITRTHLFDYWRIIRKYRWTVLACIIISMATTLIANSLKQPIYQATATILIDENRGSFTLPNQPFAYEDYYQKQRAFETHFKVIKSYPLVQMVVQRLDLHSYLQDNPQPPPTYFQRLWLKLQQQLGSISLFFKRLFLVEKDSPGKMAGAEGISKPDPLILSLQSAIEIVPIPETNLVKINVRYFDPVVAVNVSNTLAKAYQEYIVQQQLDTVKGNLSWMTRELSKLRTNMEESEQALLQYREKGNLLEADQEDSLQAGELAQLRRDYNQAKTKHIEIEAQLAELRKVINQGSNYIPAFIKSDLLDNITSQRAAAKLELEKLLKRYKSKHPKIVSIRSKINMLAQQFVEEIKKSFASINSEYLVLLSKERQLEKTLNQYTEQVIRGDQQKTQYNLLEREARANHELYNILMMQLKSVNISEGIQNRSIRFIEEAKLPDSPTRLNKALNLLISFLLGLTLGIGLAFFLDYLDRTIKGVEDVKGCLGLPVLGVIPSFDKGYKI